MPRILGNKARQVGHITDQANGRYCEWSSFRHQFIWIVDELCGVRPMIISNIFVYKYEKENSELISCIT